MKNQLLKRRKQRIVDDQVRRIMDNFNFDKVHLVMTHLDWGWASMTSGQLEVPTIFQIKHRAKDLLTRVGMGETTSLMCGGLVVHRTEPNDNLALYFYVETWNELP